MMFVEFFLLLFFAYFKISNGIRCYQCGSESIFMDYDLSSIPLPKSRIETQENTLLTLESCSNLEFAFSSWGTYAVDCAPGQVCVKNVRDEGVDEHGRHRGYFTSSRGCAMRNTSTGLVHMMGCGIFKSNIVPPVEIHENKYDLVCFCDTDYCNSTRAGKPGKFTGIIVMILTLNYVVQVMF